MLGNCGSAEHPLSGAGSTLPICLHSPHLSPLSTALMQFASQPKKKGGWVRDRTSLCKLWFFRPSRRPFQGLDWVLSPLLSLNTAPGLGSREMRWGPLSRSVMTVARGGASVIRGRGSRCWEGKVGKRSLRRIFQLTGTCLWVQEYMVNRKYQSGPPLQNDLRTSCA